MKFLAFLFVAAAILATSPALAESQIVIKLSHEEALIVRKAFDAAIRGGGADVAHALVPIDDKLMAAAREARDIDLTEEARKKVEQADKPKAPTPAAEPARASGK